MSNLYVLISFDVEHDAEPLSDRCDGVKKGIPKILDVLDYFDIHCTFNILGCIIDEYLDLFKQIKTNGHEIGCHSYNHEALGFMDDKYIYKQVEKSTNTIKKNKPNRLDKIIRGVAFVSLIAYSGKFSFLFFKT